MEMRRHMKRVVLLFFSEHLGAEDFEGGSFFPGIVGKASLAADMHEKRVAIPSPLPRHLRKQEAMVIAFFNCQAMLANYDLVHRLNAAQRRHHGDFNRDVLKLLSTHLWKSRIVKRCIFRIINYCLVNRLDAFDVTDTAAQLAVLF